jgi:hypothetical protein
MRRLVLGVLVSASLSAVAQESPATEDGARVEAAVRDAFAFLFALPSDRAGAAMGTWVVDSAATGPLRERPGRWRIVVTKLSDTGQSLEVSEMVGEPGTSPAELAAAMLAMQRLEGKISKAEAEASLELVVAINDAEVSVRDVSDEAPRSKPDVDGAELTLRVHGDWMRFDDRELEIDYARWSPASLLVAFGTFAPVETRRASPSESLATFTARSQTIPGEDGFHSIAVTAQGNEAMIDRVLKETRWSALAALLH